MTDTKKKGAAPAVATIPASRPYDGTLAWHWGEDPPEHEPPQFKRPRRKKTSSKDDPTLDPFMIGAGTEIPITASEPPTVQRKRRKKKEENGGEEPTLDAFLEPKRT